MNTLHIAIQGIEGSFHDIAAQQYFANEMIQPRCCASFEALFAAMKEDEQMLGLMAIENTIAGSLLHNYELLRDSGMVVVGEHKLHVEHSLVCHNDDNLEDIQEVNSHPVALMQCRKYLESMPHSKVVEVDDTAGAARTIAEKGWRHHAAICHADAAKRYGLKVLKRGIEDNKHNFTRFLVLAGKSQAHRYIDWEKVNKSSLVFALKHEEGSLSQVLSIFSFYRINLTKIQSLPIIGREWEYLFYVDVTFDDYQRYRQSIEAVRPLTGEIHVLGEYEGK